MPNQLEKLLFIPKGQWLLICTLILIFLTWVLYHFILSSTLQNEQALSKQMQENQSLIQASQDGFLQLKKVRADLKNKTDLKFLISKIQEKQSANEIIEKIILSLKENQLHLIAIKPMPSSNNTSNLSWKSETLEIKFSGSYDHTINWLNSFLMGFFSIQKLKMEKLKNHAVQTTLQLQIYHR